MTLQTLTSQEIAPEIDYPDSDGNPMSDNTEQYRWIVIIKENLEIMYADDPNVFVAGDLLWYPVRRTPKTSCPRCNGGFRATKRAERFLQAMDGR